MKAFPRWLVLASSFVTGVTGVVYWWMENMMQPVGEFAVVNHPLQPLVLKAHIVAAPFLVFAVGLIALDHIWKHFRADVRRGRRSGLSAMWVFVPMVLTGYLVQAVTHLVWLEVIAWAHVVTGLVYLAGLAVHQVVARRAGGERVGGSGRWSASGARGVSPKTGRVRTRLGRTAPRAAGRG